MIKLPLLLGVLIMPFVLMHTSAQSQEVVNVEIAEGAQKVDNDKFFTPSRIAIHVGAKVVWKNFDDARHTVTDGTPQSARWGTVFDSGILKLDDVFEFTFSEAGTYKYLCALHPWMAGTVSVVPEGEELDGQETPIELSIRVDKSTYKVGDDVTIEGSVSTLLQDTFLMMEISNPNDEPIFSDSVALSEDGKFSQNFKLVGAKAIPGEYRVKVSYSDGHAEGVFVVEQRDGGGGQPLKGSADLRIVAKQLRNLLLVRVTNAEDSGASIYGLTIETSNSVIQSFRGPRHWTTSDVTADEATTSVENEPLNPGEKTYLIMKVSGNDFEISFTAYDSDHNVADQGKAVTLRI